MSIDSRTANDHHSTAENFRNNLRRTGAMIWKELREIQLIAWLALTIYALLLVSLVGPSRVRQMFLIGDILDFFRSGNDVPFIPFVYDHFQSHYWWISLLLAIAIGLQQSLGESVRGTYLFLLHRPASRRWLVGVKLLTGLMTYLICSVLPILVYGVWAATHAMLFEWAMTLACWQICFTMALPYLGAFLTGICVGRWYGSRLLPLLASALPLFLADAWLHDSASTSDVLWQGIVLVIFGTWLIGAILFVAQNRDFS